MKKNDFDIVIIGGGGLSAAIVATEAGASCIVLEADVKLGRATALSPGEVYQFPLYEVGIMAFSNTGFTCLRYFKNHKGQTFVEKGIENLNLSGGKKKLVTFLALAGFIQPFFTLAIFCLTICLSCTQILSPLIRAICASRFAVKEQSTPALA